LVLPNLGRIVLVKKQMLRKIIHSRTLRIPNYSAFTYHVNTRLRMIVFLNEGTQADIVEKRWTPETSPLPGNDFLWDGETFARMYTDREKANRFAERQRKSPVVKMARVTQVG
jgi:hypothetical protein